MLLFIHQLHNFNWKKYKNIYSLTSIQQGSATNFFNFWCDDDGDYKIETSFVYIFSARGNVKLKTILRSPSFQKGWDAKKFQEKVSRSHSCSCCKKDEWKPTFSHFAGTEEKNHISSHFKPIKFIYQKLHWKSCKFDQSLLRVEDYEPKKVNRDGSTLYQTTNLIKIDYG